MHKTIKSESIPIYHSITSLDLDITQRCNLSCIYCFKGKKERYENDVMSLNTALDSIDWLIESSNNSSDLYCAFMGGEPLMQFDIIKEVVPYGKRKASLRNKSIQFSATTNMTLINDEIVSFFNDWGMGWHASIDGNKKVQNFQRPYLNGEGTSGVIEKNIKKVLQYRPTCCARATITRSMINELYDSFLYLYDVGFINIAFAACDTESWTKNDKENWRSQQEKIIEEIRRLFDKGIFVNYALTDFYFSWFAGKKNNSDRWRRDRGILRYRQTVNRQSTRDHHGNRNDPGKDGPIQEKS
jgi:sulfatase maturation enzyme AslB (radical SAM superfamily)